MNMRKAVFLSALLVSALSPAVAEKIAIVGGAVHTVSARGTMKDATVLIDGGRIVDVIPGHVAPAGYRPVDAVGKVVTPGFMESWTSLGTFDVGNGGGLNDARAGKAKYTAGLDISPAINPDNAAVAVNRLGGITRSATAPEITQGIFGGLGTLLQLGNGDMVTKKRAFMTVDMTEQGGEGAGGSRAAAWGDLRAALREAADPAYKAMRDEPMFTQIDRDALASVARGEIPLVVRANSAAEIREVLALKASMPALKLAIADAREGWRVASKIAAARVPVIVDPFLNLPEQFDSRASTLANAGRLQKAGVTVALTTSWNDGSDNNERDLPWGAGVAVANGMDWGAALAAMTANPAKIFGMTDYGTLEPGKAADVIVWSGDPFEVSETAEKVFINGEEMPPVSRQKKLAARYHPSKGNDTHPAFRR